MSILCPEKWSLNIHVSGTDTSSTDLPTSSTVFPLISLILPPQYSIIYSRLKIWVNASFLSLPFPQLENLLCVPAGLTRVRCIWDVSDLYTAFQVRHKAQLLDFFSGVQLPLPGDIRDKTCIGPNTWWEPNKGAISYFQWFVNIFASTCNELQVLNVHLLSVWPFSYHILILDIFLTTNHNNKKFSCHLIWSKSQRSSRQGEQLIFLLYPFGKRINNRKPFQGFFPKPSLPFAWLALHMWMLQYLRVSRKQCKYFSCSHGIFLQL